MNIDDREFIEKTARLVFAALVGQSGKTELAGDKTELLRGYAAFAWQAADVLLEQYGKHQVGKYMPILQNYEGTEALRRVLEFSGYSGQVLERELKRYADKPDPLKAYDEENLGYRTTGQKAVAEYLKQRRANI